MRQALGLTLLSVIVSPSNRAAGDAAKTTGRAVFSSHPRRRRRLALDHGPTSSTSSTRSHPSAAGSKSRAVPPLRLAALASSEVSLDLDHPAFSPVVSLPLRRGGGGREASSASSPLSRASSSSSSSSSSSDGGGGDGGDNGNSKTPSDTLVFVRPLHPNDVQETADALLAAFEEGDLSSGEPPVERRQLLRRLEREARRYSLDPAPWLLHSVSLPPPRAPKEAENSSSPSSSASASEEEEETEREEEKQIGEAGPWWSSLPSSAAASFGSTAAAGLPGSLKKKRQAAELEALEEEKAAAAWEEALEDAWGRWLWLVAEARSSSSDEEKQGNKKRKRKIVGAAALLFHDRSSSLRALERLATSEFGFAPENKKRWPVADVAAMDYCLWLRESFPAAGWPPRVSSSSSPSSSSSSSSEGVFGRSASLWWVGTLPAARGKGVGAALLDACAAVAAAAGFDRMFAQVEEWSDGSGLFEGSGSKNARGRRSGGLSGAPWLGGSSEATKSSSSSCPSPLERMYRSAGFVAVPDPPPKDFRRDAGAVDESAVLLQRELW